jgi:cobalt-zinc-cadmium resistance protein CzcA
LHRIEYLPEIDTSSALSDNPSQGYTRQQIEVSQLETKLEKSKMLPDLNIGYSSQTIKGTQEVNGVNRTFGSGNRFNSFQIGVAVPLWFGSGKSKTKAAKMKEQISRINAENFSKTLLSNYRSLLMECEKDRKSLDYYEKQAVPEADLIIKQSSLSYKEGEMDYIGYIGSLARALMIKQNYIDVLNNYNQSVISIDYITGKIF